MNPLTTSFLRDGCTRAVNIVKCTTMHNGSLFWVAHWTIMLQAGWEVLRYVLYYIDMLCFLCTKILLAFIPYLFRH